MRILASQKAFSRARSVFSAADATAKGGTTVGGICFFNAQN